MPTPLMNLVFPYLLDIINLFPFATRVSPYVDVFVGLHNSRQVTLKQYRVQKTVTTRKEAIKRTVNEAFIQYNLQGPGVVPLLGVFSHEEGPCNTGLYLVTPFPEPIPIALYLETSPAINRCLLVRDALRGLFHVHAKGAVHGNIGEGSVFVNSSGRAVIGGFGFARRVSCGTQAVPSSSEASRHVIETAPYQPPEVLAAHLANEPISLTVAGDVYSMSCWIYKVMTGYTPFYEVGHGAQPLHRLCLIMEEVQGGKLPLKPRVTDPAFIHFGLTQDLWGMMTECWDRVPERRPSTLTLAEWPSLSDIADPRPRP
ncbi:kinase-like domain-containing protein [Ephemerocybe angulata]|uniref:Kinase-like domain-containing protein n=1 Tax=Ephemerocybe angulata TaxID=980116 RepID=A0A8H6I6F3_9AGAR|nr:kinase-like domain-containing protein [Tulosesus angulatus]